MEIIVKVTVVTGDPCEARIAHFGTVFLDLRGGGPADDCETDVARSEMFERWEVVEIHGAGVAGVGPVGGEHGVVDDELGAVVEEVLESHWGGGFGVDEGVGFGEFGDGEGLALLGQVVFEVDEFLFFGEEGEAGFEV